MASMGERIKERMRALDMSATQLSSITDISKSTISAIINDRTNGITADKIFPLAHALEVDPEWLYSGVTDTKTYRAFEQVDESVYATVPMYYVHFGMGAQGLPSYEEVSTYKPLLIENRFFVEKRRNPKHCKAFIAVGDSMEPLIHDNDVVLVDTEDKEVAESYKIFAFVDNNDTLRIKYLSRKLNGSIVVKSENSDGYENELIEGDDLNKIQIIGRVIARFGNLR